MTDREKVIKGLGIVSRMFNEMGRRNEMDIVDDALALLKEDCHNCKLECLLQKYDELKEKYDALLKEQEAVAPEKEHSGSCITWWNVCGNCKTAINPNDKYCHECGKAVKWNE